MIDYYTGTPQEQSKSEFYEAPNLAPMQLNTLTLERNAVLVARLSRNSGYDFEELNILKRTLQDCFPNHNVFIWYDDIDFTVINDNGYKPERIATINDTSNYY